MRGGKGVKSGAGESGRPVDRPCVGRPPSLVSYCLNRRELSITVFSSPWMFSCLHLGKGA